MNIELGLGVSLCPTRTWKTSSDTSRIAHYSNSCRHNIIIAHAVQNTRDRSIHLSISSTGWLAGWLSMAPVLMSRQFHRIYLPHEQQQRSFGPSGAQADA